MARIYVTVSGNIGVGKSTFARKLAATLGLRHFPEPVTNPYLADYYRHKERWGFHSQIQFALDYSQVHRLITASPDAVCQDRNLYECHVFVNALTRAGILSERESQTVSRFIDHCLAGSQVPDLLVYLSASIPTLLERIGRRAHGCEQSIDAGYLAHLQSAYDEWISTFNLCPVLRLDADRRDLALDPAHLGQACAQIASLLGLEQPGEPCAEE